jgi:periplasmic divalent cation tolerance protein
MDEKSEPILIYATFGDRENALTVAHGLIEARLGACANILDNVTSVFEWEGKIGEEGECILLVKTLHRLENRVIDYISEQHSYEEPSILVIPITAGAEGFLNWAAGQVRGS